MKENESQKRPVYGDTLGAEIFARRLAERRLEYGWTQADVEHESGIDRSYISLLEGGHRPRVSMSVVARLASALNTSTEWLWGLTDDPRPAADAHDPLTPLELGLLELFRMLPENLQRLAVHQLDLWLDHRDLWHGGALNGEET